MHHTQVTPLAGTVAGFFKQFPFRRCMDILARINLSCGQFKQGSAQWIAILPLEDQFSAIKRRNDYSSPLMDDVLTSTFLAVRQTDPVKPDVKKSAGKTWLPSICVSTRWASSVALGFVIRNLQQKRPD